MIDKTEWTKERSLRDHRLFGEVAEALAALEVPFWLDQGTLLGVIREGKLLESDHDIDLGMWEEDYRQIAPALEKKLKGPGRWLETYKPHQLSIRVLDGEADIINIAFYRRREGMAVKKIYYPGGGRAAGMLVKTAVFCARAADGSLGKKLPAGVFYRFLAGAARVLPASLWQFFSFRAGRMQYHFKPFVIMAVPEHFFMRLEQISVENMNLKVPADPEAYLALKYGTDWRRPRDEWVFWKDDGAITRPETE